jgi:diguanylate cyclase (GGDEF)-like protein
VEDAKRDFRFDVDKMTADESRPVRSLIGAPLAIGQRLLGILRVDGPRENDFTTDDLRFLTTITDLGAVALENARLYECLEELAVRDSLTGLYLRRFLLGRMGEEMTRHLRSGKELSFLMVDLDEFKKYNDQFGHIAGDIVLKVVGKILQESFQQPGDIVGRYGGEEFAVLLPDCPKKSAIELAHGLREKIEKQSIMLRRQQTRVTISVGIASFPEDARVKEGLIQRADQALYKAKKEGRDRVCWA